MIDDKPCEICSSRPAKVVILRRRQGNDSRTFVCLECANERARLYGASGVGIDQVVEYLDTKASGSDRPSAACRLCGTTLAEIVADATPGCSLCYARFAAEIEPAIRNAHGKTSHAGKAPRR